MKSIDHYVLMVTDQEAARETYSKLGFHVRPTALHIELGSTNAIVHFETTYLELIHLQNAMKDLKEQYIERFECGPGLAHVSLTSDDLKAESARLKDLGFTPGPITNARRKITFPDGRADETDSSFVYNWQARHRFLSLFFSEHVKPDTIFIPDYAVHPNGARDLTRMVFVSGDPTADLDYFKASYGQEPDQTSADGFIMRGARGDLAEVLTQAAIVRRYGTLAGSLDLGSLGGFPIAMHYSVKDRDTARACLVNNGVAVTDIASGIGVSMDQAEGCVLVFE